MTTNTKPYTILCVVCGNKTSHDDKRICPKQCAPLPCFATSFNCYHCDESYDALEDWHETKDCDENGPYGMCVFCFNNQFCSHCNKKLTDDEFTYAKQLWEFLCTDCGYRFLK